MLGRNGCLTSAMIHRVFNLQDVLLDGCRKSSMIIKNKTALFLRNQIPRRLSSPLKKSNSWNAYHQDTYVFNISSSGQEGNKAKWASRFGMGCLFQRSSLMLEHKTNKEWKHLFSQGHVSKSAHYFLKEKLEN